MAHIEDLSTDVKRVFARYIRSVPGGVSLGPFGTLSFSCFLDLLSAAHNPSDLRLLAESLGQLIKGLAKDGEVKAIVAPKRGNPLLITEVSRVLELPSAFVRDEVLFGRYMEGAILKGARAILADDVSSDGELLTEAVINLRKEGVFVDSVFVLVERTEGNARKLLENESVSLFPLVEVDDHALEQLLADRQRGAL